MNCSGNVTEVYPVLFQVLTIKQDEGYRNGEALARPSTHGWICVGGLCRGH